jgi:hypothetical protein
MNEIELEAVINELDNLLQIVRLDINKEIIVNRIEKFDKELAILRERDK